MEDPIEQQQENRLDVDLRIVHCRFPAALVCGGFEVLDSVVVVEGFVLPQCADDREDHVYAGQDPWHKLEEDKRSHLDCFTLFFFVVEIKRVFVLK